MRNKLLILILNVLVLSSLAFAKTMPKRELWEFWKPSDPNSRVMIDHSAFQRWLDKYSYLYDGNTYVAYKRVSLKDTNKLNSYLLYLQSLKIRRYNRKEQKAFWLNLYNAKTLSIILERYPIHSIRDITFRVGFFSKVLKTGPWHHPILKVEGQEVSLDDIVNRILRPIWRDPRVLFALSNASMSGPNLPLEAFTGKNLDTLLKSATKQFINHEKGILIADNKLQISPFFRWYRSDFGGGGRPTLAFINQYASPHLQEEMKKYTSYSLQEFDWRLNDYQRIDRNKKKNRK